MMPTSRPILTVNGGSSSIKFALFETGDSFRRILKGGIDRIGLPQATFWLLGISATSSDMRELLDREKDDVRAAEAVALFCYQIKKVIGSFAAALGGLDTLVFAGGIGENAHPVRARICNGLEFLGVELHQGHNAANDGVISSATSRVAVRVIHTDEELMIARSVCRVLGLAISSEPMAEVNS